MYHSSENISTLIIAFSVIIILFVLFLLLIWRKYVKLKGLLRLRDQYYGVIAHDLKSPYLAYFKILERIRHSVSVGNITYANDQLDYLENSFYATKNILFNMMRWSQYTDKLNDYKPEKTNMEDFMHESTEHLISHAKLNNIELLVLVDIHEHPIIYKHYVSAILRNLIDNIIKHADCSKINVSSTIDNANLIITIVHDGDAMPDNIRKALINKNQSQTVVENYGNMGLGLAIIYKSLKKCGGKLEVNNSEISDSIVICFPLMGV